MSSLVHRLTAGTISFHMWALWRSHKLSETCQFVLWIFCQSSALIDLRRLWNRSDLIDIIEWSDWASPKRRYASEPRTVSSSWRKCGGVQFPGRVSRKITYAWLTLDCIAHLQMQRFTETVSSCVAILLKALENGTYRFSFYLPSVTFSDPNEYASVLAEGIDLRVREIAEGIVEEEETVGRHDILTGRLLVCL